MWMGSSASSADEWIELFNRADREIDLSGWTITRLTDQGEQLMVKIEQGVIPAGQVFLIANYPPDHENSRLAVQAQLVDPAVSLPNSKLQLRLYNGLPEEGARLMDVADDGMGAPLAGDNQLKRAMVRVAFDQSGEQAHSWATAQEGSGWDENAQELGTPGSLPDYLQPAHSVETGPGTLVRPVAWAFIKKGRD
jgi:hypothetical protein